MVNEVRFSFYLRYYNADPFGGVCELKSYSIILPRSFVVFSDMIFLVLISFFILSLQNAVFIAIVACTLYS